MDAISQRGTEITIHSGIHCLNGNFSRPPCMSLMNEVWYKQNYSKRWYLNK